MSVSSTVGIFEPGKSIRKGSSTHYEGVVRDVSLMREEYRGNWRGTVGDKNALFKHIYGSTLASLHQVMYSSIPNKLLSSEPHASSGLRGRSEAGPIPSCH
jgi:hypothetical protein